MAPFETGALAPDGHFYLEVIVVTAAADIVELGVPESGVAGEARAVTGFLPPIMDRPLERPKSS